MNFNRLDLTYAGSERNGEKSGWPRRQQKKVNRGRNAKYLRSILNALIWVSTTPSNNTY